MGEPRQTLADLATNPSLIEQLTPQHATALLTEMAALQLALAAHLVAMSGCQAEVETHAPEKAVIRMLTLDDAVERSRKSRGWFHTHWRKLPFARKVGRTILFPELEFEKWLRRH